jgi:serine/threonine-protein kinase
MAELYLGRHTTLDRPVAVKILHSHLSEDEKLLSRFRDEAKAVAKMRHPNIVQVFDFDVADDRPYIVMELIAGVALDDYLDARHEIGRNLSPETVARLIRDLAAALDYAHARGIVHRDIKPSNVMLRREAGPVDPSVPLKHDVQPVLTDFGIARLSTVAGRTASGEIVGTPAYMSPEQVRGESVDARSDIYSLGVMLYELLSGKTPFDPGTETAAAILIKHMTEEPAPLPGATPEIQAVLDRALDKDREKRFQKAGDLAVVLHHALDLPVPEGSDDVDPFADTLATAQGATPIVQTTPDEVMKSSTSPAWIIGGGLALVVLLIGIVVGGLMLATMGRGGADAPTEVEETIRSDAEGEPEPGPAEAAVAVDTTASHGVVIFQGDGVFVSLFDLEPPPDGFVYEAWLLADGEDFSLEVAEVVEGQLSVTFSPAEEALLDHYTGFMLTLEPVGDTDPAPSSQTVYLGQYSDESLLYARHLLAETRGEQIQEAVLSGLPSQAAAYDSHLSFAVEGAEGGNLEGAKLHSEHVINIIEGSAGSDFGDWDGDGQTQNPGDDVGLIPYLHILGDAARLTAAAPGASAERQAALEEFAATADVLILSVEDTRDLAKRITASDTVEEAQPLATEMDATRSTFF